MGHFYTLGTIDETGLGHPCIARICWKLTDTIHTGGASRANPYPWSQRLRALIMWGEVFDPTTKQLIVGGQCIDDLVRYFRSDPVAQRLANTARRWSYNHLRRGSLLQEDHLRSHPYPGYPLEFESWARVSLKLAGLDPCPHTGHVYGKGYIHESLPISVIQDISSCSHEANDNEKQYTGYGF